MSDTELENQPGSDSLSGQSLNGNKEQSSSVGQERTLELKRNKRVRKAAVTRLRHSIEKLCVKKDEIDIQLVEKRVASLWDLLEKKHGHNGRT